MSYYFKWALGLGLVYGDTLGNSINGWFGKTYATKNVHEPPFNSEIELFDLSRGCKSLSSNYVNSVLCVIDLFYYSAFLLLYCLTLTLQNFPHSLKEKNRYFQTI